MASEAMASAASSGYQLTISVNSITPVQASYCQWQAADQRATSAAKGSKAAGKAPASPAPTAKSLSKHRPSVAAVAVADVAKPVTLSTELTPIALTSSDSADASKPPSFQLQPDESSPSSQQPLSEHTYSFAADRHTQLLQYCHAKAVTLSLYEHGSDDKLEERQLIGTVDVQLAAMLQNTDGVHLLSLPLLYTSNTHAELLPTTVELTLSCTPSIVDADSIIASNSLQLSVLQLSNLPSFWSEPPKVAEQAPTSKRATAVLAADSKRKTTTGKLSLKPATPQLAEPSIKYAVTMTMQLPSGGNSTETHEWRAQTVQIDESQPAVMRLTQTAAVRHYLPASALYSWRAATRQQQYLPVKVKLERTDANSSTTHTVEGEALLNLSAALDTDEATLTLTIPVIQTSAPVVLQVPVPDAVNDETSTDKAAGKAKKLNAKATTPASDSRPMLSINVPSLESMQSMLQLQLTFDKPFDQRAPAVTVAQVVQSQVQAQAELQAVCDELAASERQPEALHSKLAALQQLHQHYSPAYFEPEHQRAHQRIINQRTSQLLDGCKLYARQSQSVLSSSQPTVQQIEQLLFLAACHQRSPMAPASCLANLNYQQAIVQCELLIDSDPSNTEYSYTLAQCYYQYALYHQQQRQSTLAVVCLQQALEQSQQSDNRMHPPVLLALLAVALNDVDDLTSSSAWHTISQYINELEQYSRELPMITRCMQALYALLDEDDEQYAEKLQSCQLTDESQQQQALIELQQLLPHGNFNSRSVATASALLFTYLHALHCYSAAQQVYQAMNASEHTIAISCGHVDACSKLHQAQTAVDIWTHVLASTQDNESTADDCARMAEASATVQPTAALAYYQRWHEQRDLASKQVDVATTLQYLAALQEQQQHQDVIAVCSTVIRAQSTSLINPYVYHCLANALIALQDYSAALDALSLIAQIDVLNPLTHLQMAALCFSLGDASRAREHSQHALQYSNMLIVLRDETVLKELLLNWSQAGDAVLVKRIEFVMQQISQAELTDRHQDNQFAEQMLVQSPLQSAVYA